MNITELKPGDYVRITGSLFNVSCIGCVLKFVNGKKGMVAIMETIGPVCIRRGDTCSLMKSDSVELLSPEEVMEVKLST